MGMTFYFVVSPSSLPPLTPTKSKLPSLLIWRWGMACVAYMLVCLCACVLARMLTFSISTHKVDLPASSLIPLNMT